MSWLTRHRLRRSLRSSPFLAPAASIVVALLESTVEGAWESPPDRAIAGASDLQGFGSRARGA